MSEAPTPEVDLFPGLNSKDDLIALARRLHRERDEARGSGYYQACLEIATLLAPITVSEPSERIIGMVKEILQGRDALRAHLAETSETLLSTIKHCENWQSEGFASEEEALNSVAAEIRGVVCATFKALEKTKP